MPVGIGIAAVGVGAVSSNVASNRASGVAKDSAERADAMELLKFDEAKKQADLLRQRGDEAAAVALEEGARAELGAQKFEQLSNFYADRADQLAANIQKAAVTLYGQGVDAATAKQKAGQEAQSAILSSAQGVKNAAAGTDARLTSALGQSTGYLDAAMGNISDRYTPFMDSERRAIGQLDAEMGLTTGTQYKGYQDTPAYLAAQDASRVTQQENIQAIDQAAGNSGTLYSGTRGAALSDRAAQGSWERAGIEQSYYQNYMNMLRDMANPVSTGTVSGYEATNAANKASMTMGAAGDISNAYMNAAGTDLNAQIAARQTGLNTMRTGLEGQELMQYLNTGTAGAPYALSGVNLGTAGSAYRTGAQDYRLGAQQGAGAIITGNAPTGIPGINARMEGVSAQNAALADFAGGATSLASAYMQYGR